LATGALDILTAAGVLWAVLPDTFSYSFVVAVCMFANVAGAMSQVPGGLGVFEGVVLLLMGADANVPSVLAALVAYRAIYCVLPFLRASGLLGWRALRKVPRYFMVC